MTKADVWKREFTQQLIAVLTTLTDEQEMQRFLRDVMTDTEVREIGARLEAARLLAQGARYTDITAATDLSSRTVARVSDWLANGTGGYALAIEHLENNRKKEPA